MSRRRRPRHIVVESYNDYLDRESFVLFFTWAIPILLIIVGYSILSHYKEIGKDLIYVGIIWLSIPLYFKFFRRRKKGKKWFFISVIILLFLLFLLFNFDTIFLNTFSDIFESKPSCDCKKVCDYYFDNNPYNGEKIAFGHRHPSLRNNCECWADNIDDYFRVTSFSLEECEDITVKLQSPIKVDYAMEDIQPEEI